EAVAADRAERAEGEDLDRRLLPRHALLAPAAIDHCHAAAAQFGVQGPAAELVAGEVAAERIECRARAAVRGHELAEPLPHRFDQRLSGEPGLAPGFGEVQPLVE